MTSILQLTGALVIAFVYSWKLALVATFVTVPIGLGCAYYRFKYEIEFEKMSAAVSPQSLKSLLFSPIVAIPHPPPQRKPQS